MGSMGEFLDVVGGGEVGSSDVDGAAVVKEDRDSTCSVYGLYCAVASVKFYVFREVFNSYRSSSFGVDIFSGVSYCWCSVGVWVSIAVWSVAWV